MLEGSDVQLVTPRSCDRRVAEARVQQTRALYGNRSLCTPLPQGGCTDISAGIYTHKLYVTQESLHSLAIGDLTISIWWHRALNTKATQRTCARTGMISSVRPIPAPFANANLEHGILDG